MTEQKQVALSYYKDAIELLMQCGVEFMLGGAYALGHYTGIYRDTKDLDVFCRSSDYTKILKFFAEKGYQTEITDARWLAKVFRGDHYIDIIFDTPNTICTVDDTWFQYASQGKFDTVPVLVLPAEELVWCKIYVQNRERFDGADVNHIFLRYGKQLDWKRVLFRLDQHWHLLLAQIIIFQFVYPSDYQEIIPKWLFDELMTRAGEQYELPSPMARVCRGPILDQTQYSVDVKEWDYKVYTMKSV